MALSAEVFVAALSPFVLLAAAILGIGYLAFRARRAREEAAVRARLPEGPDPVEELARVNRQMRERLAEAQRSLEGARDAFRRGLRGP